MTEQITVRRDTDTRFTVRGQLDHDQEVRRAANERVLLQDLPLPPMAVVERLDDGWWAMIGSNNLDVFTAPRWRTAREALGWVAASMLGMRT